MRKCPVCSTNLHEEKMSSEEIDRCPGCGGIFFDRGELESIISLVKTFNSIKLKETDIDTITESEGNRILNCPVDNSPMEKKEIAGTIIDSCPECEGIWLDNHEITALKIAEKHIKENITLYIKLGGDVK